MATEQLVEIIIEQAITNHLSTEELFVCYREAAEATVWSEARN